MANNIDIQELKRLHAAAEVGVGTQRDVAVAMNAAYRHLPALIARLEAAEAAMQWRCHKCGIGPRNEKEDS